MPPKKKVRRLLERAKISKGGWTRKDIDALLEGYGFKIEGRTNHDMAIHKDYPDLWMMLPRHATELRKGYITQAVKLIGRAEERESGEENE